MFMAVFAVISIQEFVGTEVYSNSVCVVRHVKADIHLQSSSVVMG